MNDVNSIVDGSQLQVQTNIDDDSFDRGIPDLQSGKSRSGKAAKIMMGLAVGAILIFIATIAFSKNYTKMRAQKKAEEEKALIKKTSGEDAQKVDIAADQAAMVALPAPAYAVDANGQTIAPITETPNAESKYAVAPSSTSTDTYVSPQPVYTDYSKPSTASSASYNVPSVSVDRVIDPQSLIKERQLGSAILAVDGGSSMLGGGNSSSNSNNQDNQPEQNGNQKQGGLEASLSHSNFSSAKVNQRQDLSSLLRHGTVIPCVLKSRIDSTHAGFVTCQVTKDVYSANGKLLLVERGSDVTGEQRTGITQGQARVAVIWTRLETPTGVTIDIDSPAADNLGASGIEAKVNTHFWKRFGGAMMLSIINDAFATLANGQRTTTEAGGVSVQNTTAASQEMAKTALENSINIAPTATVNQGTVVSVFVARDVDFRGVYERVSEK